MSRPSRSRGFSLVEMLVTLLLTSVVFALVAVLARDVALAEERLRVEMLGGDSLRLAAARLSTELARAAPGGVEIQGDTKIRVQTRGGRTVRLSFPPNALVRTAEDLPIGDPARVRSWAMTGTLRIVDTGPRTITLRFSPARSSREELFVLGTETAAAEEAP